MGRRGQGRPSPRLTQWVAWHNLPAMTHPAPHACIGAPTTSALHKAARVASLSNRVAITANQLRDIVVSGVVPLAHIGHMQSFFADASLVLFSEVVDEIHHDLRIERMVLWDMMGRLGNDISTHCPVMGALDG